MRTSRSRVFGIAALALALGATACDSTTGPKYPDPVDKEGEKKDDDAGAKPRIAAPVRR